MRHSLLVGLVLAMSTALATPESDYMIHCMGCHLADGRGLPPDVPAFDDKLASLTTSDAGRAYLVRVPGSSQAPLDDEALAAVLNWILQTYTDADVKPFSGEEVKIYRRTIMKNPAAERALLVDD